MATIHLVKLNNYPILEQLRMEEALLRADSRNWCILNNGSTPAIVMGISGKPEQLIDPSHTSAIPVIRRFSGGGTVVVDSNTYFASFICNQECTGVKPFPDQVHCWAKELYRFALDTLAFDLLENDYVIGDRKFGGNAQYLQKNRWLHHSTLLWDYDFHLMQKLLLPPKRPNYRKDRSHEEFLCRLSDVLEKKEMLEERLLHSLAKHFNVEETPLSTVEEILQKPHRKATEVIKI